MRDLRRQVSIAVAAGMPREKIAALMALDVAKLETLFAAELAHGAERVKLDQLLLLDAAAAEGKVAAARAVLEVIDGTSPPSAPKKPEPSAGGTKLQRAALLLLQGGQSKRES